MTRTDIERVVAKYIWKLERTAAVESQPRMSANFVSQLVDDLLALTPQPSREGLESIIFKYYSPSAMKTQSVGASGREDILKGLFNDLMAWATGTQTWCEHIRWYEQTATMGHAGVDAGWGLTQMSLSASVDDTWTCCPICSAKRP